MEELVKIETLKLAEEKGFDSSSTPYRDTKTGEIVVNYEARLKYFKSEKDSDMIRIPTQSVIHKWLREAHIIDVSIIPHYREEGRFYRCGIVFINDENKIDTFFLRPSEGDFKDAKFIESPTYEEALEAGLLESLKLI